MARADRQHRGLHYRRTEYKPGLGVCNCEFCGFIGAERSTGGINPDCAYINREAVFAEEWEKENLANPGLNYGWGVLQDLMVTTRPAKPGQPSARASFSHFCRLRVAFVLNRRDRCIAATLIQWLGSNCGFAWLTEVLAKCGYEIRRIEKTRKRPQ